MEKIIEILNDIRPGVDYENETGLIDNELIDSVELMQLITELEDNYDISIDMEDIVPENFNSVEAIMNLVKKLQDE